MSRLPTPAEIAGAVAFERDVVDWDEIDFRDPREITVYARTQDGTTFGFTVTVSAPWYTD